MVSRGFAPLVVDAKIDRIPVGSTDLRKKGARSDAEASPKELVSCKKRFAAFLSVSKKISVPCYSDLAR